MIETDRLLLRPIRIDDFETYTAVWVNKPMANNNAPGLAQLSEEEIWNRLLRWIGHWKTFDFGPFAVIDRVSGTVIGEVGLAHFRRGHGPSYDGVPEAMWRVEHSWHGRGIATEATQAAFAWFDAKQISTRTVCMIDTWNDASKRVAGRLGFKMFRVATHRGNSVQLFERVLDSD
ncbi:GNAT family N-acetyltransferase [Phyllobacterium sp. LjRoot231]|uniref:GNAT family N-acetyltransferase n=1 Tax=Phyllobacterium sp. LjRoot231 TaxID=3342289 RepID=UPI003ECC7BE0